MTKKVKKTNKFIIKRYRRDIFQGYNCENCNMYDGIVFHDFIKLSVFVRNRKLCAECSVL